MTKRSLQVCTVFLLIAASSYAAKENVIRFENTVRLGYDDNIYTTDDKTGSAFITDIINLSAKLNFSTRTDALLYWQPEFQYRFDADPGFITYQDLYAKLNHAISQRLFFTLSDRFRYQQKEGQVGNVSDYNQNYFENDLMGALDYTLNDVSGLRGGADYVFRTWDDSDYGEGTQNNDFDKWALDGSYYRQVKPNKTQVMGGVNYTSLSYAGDRGGYDSTTLMVGADQNFSANTTGFGRLGWSFNDVDSNMGGSDSSSPYLQAGLEMNPSARSSYTTSIGYSMQRAENSYYNAQDQFNVRLAGRYDITAKINLSGSLQYIYSSYDGDYSEVTGSPDADDNYFSLGLRCAYQINRNNFVDLGYLFRTRTASTEGGVQLSDWDGNRFDVSWRLRL